MNNKTIQYYDNNSQAFYNRSVNTDLSNTYKAFLKLLPVKAHILDAGCGVGRDSKWFINHGYTVTAFDASKEMVRIASKETGLNVKRLKFQDIDFYEMFDGVWARASLLHVPYQETRKIYDAIHQALKPQGIFYASYAYGADHVHIFERDFYNMNEETIKPYLEGLFDIIEIWQEENPRGKFYPNLRNMLLNFIAKKL